ncbi:hypothetical protein PHYSODRAFT_259396 [Phytophthora sojae]|uniref:DUF4219 domain-containing protein n=1 Tax=Phytophthora sojae (strain P6497) TaxID=1094619 RepID=G4Z3W8_PHYSP|nr:hypothetical protein PHYSODRAFT_259396 [Phytophthora sojae]EGZ20827.1 hypothetical protein PHYSODRAFT_259396 [Phytophthora sojae]|eukprot:XP_009523544.1 hypothetical protein PHYSODRAFT_259396 [Phytophthora sojae]
MRSLSSDDSSSNSSRDSDSTSSSSSDDSSSSDSGREKKRKRSSKKKKKKSSKYNHDRRSAQHDSNLEVPKLTGADHYELWHTMIELKLKVQKLWSLVTEETVKKDSWSFHRKRRWESRW